MLQPGNMQCTKQASELRSLIDYFTLLERGDDGYVNVGTGRVERCSPICATNQTLPCLAK
jgi:hypothetical protein